jgi:DNA-binding beta-propeller fold protein YncE
LFTVNYGDASVTAINLASDKAVWSLKLGGHPQAIAMDRTKNRLYVADAQGRSIAVIDVAKDKLLRAIHTANSPYAVVIDAASHRVIAAVTGGDTGYEEFRAQ